MHLSGIFLHLLVHLTISSIFQQYQHLQSMSGIVKNFLACSILSFLHFLACSIIFKHFLACLAFSNISSSSIFLGLAASGKTNNHSFQHFLKHSNLNVVGWMGLVSLTTLTIGSPSYCSLVVFISKVVIIM